MHTLPTRQRMAVALYFAGDRTAPEIASILGCPEGTVYSDLGQRPSGAGRRVGTLTCHRTSAQQAHIGSMDISDDRALAVEEAGRRAGAALRSPAPAHGAAAIQTRAHRRRVVRVAATTAGLGVLVVAGLMVIRTDDRSVEQRPADTLPATITPTVSGQLQSPHRPRRRRRQQLQPPLVTMARSKDDGQRLPSRSSRSGPPCFSSGCRRSRRPMGSRCRIAERIHV